MRIVISVSPPRSVSWCGWQSQVQRNVSFSFDFTNHDKDNRMLC